MEYKFLDSSVDLNTIALPPSDEINNYLLKNNYSEIIKGLEFFDKEDILLYLHGFLGTGKRQYVNYINKFLDKEVIKLEHYCKVATVCDDILLNFIDLLENDYIKVPTLNAKITTLAIKFQQYVATTSKPFLIVLHSFDDIPEENRELVIDCLEKISKGTNVKIIISSRAILPQIAGSIKACTNITLKAFSKENFEEFVKSNKVLCDDSTMETFFKTTRGYYFYTALAIKIIQAQKISLPDFLDKYAQSKLNFDNYLGQEYISLIPQTIRNFFWFLRTIRHGVSLNALAVYELYDEFSIEYLKTNLIIFQVGEELFVQDYFQQNIKISIPPKVEIKLHKFIISIYEKELKEPLKNRSIMMSRQAFRVEIDYHNKCIYNIENVNVEEKTAQEEVKQETDTKQEKTETLDISIESKMSKAKKCIENNSFTQAIETYLDVIENETLNSRTLSDIRLELARLYKKTKDYTKSQHYYELVEKYYISAEENINLNYLYSELAELYHILYKNERAIETVKKVIYSVDTPQSLMVHSCTLLGNIYSDTNQPDEAYKYYQKALESIDENLDNDKLAELYFKYALACDEHGEMKEAFDYYNKCIAIQGENPYRSLAYSNLGSCYLENSNIADASYCFHKSYDIEKAANNYDGIYYAASNLAKLYLKTIPSKAYDFLLEAKQCAEFINEGYYIVESAVELGDYYYNQPDKYKEALKEYKQALEYARRIGENSDIEKIEQRINDMNIRMKES